MKRKPGRPAPAVGKKLERGLERNTSERKRDRKEREVDDQAALEQLAEDVARALNKNLAD